jgi:NAD(P)-dependent dehydrogenase (short-subunit alcohol dehydrogenase family)
MRMAAPDFRLDGKTVAVTGASRGIGAACALACAQAGAHAVVLLGRSPDALAAVARRIERCGAKASIAPCDVTCTASIRAAFDALARVDVLVNCAGANQPEPFAGVREETFDRLFALNVRGAFFATQAAVRIMRATDDRPARPGTIIMISSQMGHVGAAQRSVYCATKHAIEGLTRALAVELAPEGIRVLSIAPTFVRTAMTAAQLDDPEVGPALLGQIPLGRFGTVEEVAGAVVYAASPAAALMTGTSLVLDGGWTAR